MTLSPGRGHDDLTATLAEINRATPVAAALFDYEGRRSWAFDGDRWFHAASTIKIAVLAGIYATLRERGLEPQHRLAISNQFASVLDGSPYSVIASRDTDPGLHGSADQTMSVGELAHRMIAISSNLATNVLLEFVGVDR